jgi:HAD superfamily hydrolase (TIGR01509 family)
MIKAIFFDFNGIIIDDENLQMQAYHEVLQEHGIDLPRQWYFDCLGMDDRSFVQAIFDRAGKQLSSEVLSAVLKAKERTHRSMIEEQLPLFPGVVTFIKAASRQFSLNLVSMASRLEVEYVLERTGMSSLFSVVVTAGDVSLCKPAPDCYSFALEKMNEKRQHNRILPLLPAECLAIEDAPPGITSARHAGMRTLGVTNTVSESELRAAGAEVVTHSLADWTVDAVLLVYS